jgi:hypothetical protein
MMHHERRALRSLELHTLIALKLKENPDLLDIAKNRVNNNPELYKEWNAIFSTLSFEEILDLLKSNSHHATILRESSPFAGILNDTERLEIFNKFKQGTKSLTEKIVSEHINESSLFYETFFLAFNEERIHANSYKRMVNSLDLTKDKPQAIKSKTLTKEQKDFLLKVRKEKSKNMSKVQKLNKRNIF